MINKIKDYISEEYQKGNKDPYKKVLNYCIRIYRNENKSKVAVWNANYRDKKRINLNEKKNNSLNGVNIFN